MTSPFEIAPPAPRQLDGDELGDELPGDLLGDELPTPAAAEDFEPGPVTEPMVRDLLAGSGAMAHLFFGGPEDELWIPTDDELDALVPAFTRYVNRRPRLQKAVAHGDELLVLTTLGQYLGRNLAATAAAKKEGRDGHGEREGRPRGAPHRVDGRTGPVWGRPAADAAAGRRVPPPPGS